GHDPHPRGRHRGVPRGRHRPRRGRRETSAASTGEAAAPQVGLTPTPGSRSHPSPRAPPRTRHASGNSDRHLDEFCETSRGRVPCRPPAAKPAGPGPGKGASRRGISSRLSRSGPPRWSTPSCPDIAPSGPLLLLLAFLLVLLSLHALFLL